MKFKNVLPIIIVVFSFCSCSKGSETALEIKALQEEVYTVPIEEALSSLESFMVEKGMVKTKGSLSDYIDNYFPVSVPATKAAAAQGNVIYAVNFKDEGGYAILAADTRIQEDILAVTDQGSITEDDFLEPVFEKIPTDNDDLSVSEYEAMVESGALAALSRQVNKQCLLYATRRVDDVGGYGSGGGSGSGGTGTVTYSWKTVREVPRMINTAWTQSTENNDIFNKYCPEVGLIWKRKAPAGCVCIALSQIIAYHEYPYNLTCNRVPIDYPEIKKIYSYDKRKYEGSDEGKEMLALFCSGVGGWCRTKYGSIFGEAWGFAWPSDAKYCLETFEYKNVSLNWSYDERQVLKSLDNGCPVFMSAIAGLISGHAWVIDGYMKRNYVSSSGTVKESQTLVHCNWGWGGSCNGYFTSGIFRTKDAATYDFTSRNSENYNFWYAFNTITYDKPL